MGFRLGFSRAETAHRTAQSSPPPRRRAHGTLGLARPTIYIAHASGRPHPCQLCRLGHLPPGQPRRCRHRIWILCRSLSRTLVGVTCSDLRPSPHPRPHAHGQMLPLRLPHSRACLTIRSAVSGMPHNPKRRLGHASQSEAPSRARITIRAGSHATRRPSATPWARRTRARTWAGASSAAISSSPDVISTAISSSPDEI